MLWYRDYTAQYRCGACHVRTGTLAFGIVQLLAMAFAVAFFGVCFLQPDAIPKPVQATFLRTFDLITMGYSNTNPSNRLGSRGMPVDPSTKTNDVQQMDVVVYADGSSGVAGSKRDTPTVADPMASEGKANGVTETTVAPAGHTEGAFTEWLASPSRGEARRTMVISKWSEEDRVAVLVLLALGLLVTGLLCVGIIRRRPSWMMPYFCLQVFDLCITCISMLAYFANVPNPKDFSMESHGRPRYEDTLNGQLFLVLMGALVMFGKMYWISIVWACYKYLIEQLRMDIASGRTRRGIADRTSQVTRTNGDDAESDLIVAMSLSLADTGLSAPSQTGPSPPKYSDVVSKIPANAHAPPPYFEIAACDVASTSYGVPPPSPPPVDANAPPPAPSASCE